MTWTCIKEKDCPYRGSFCGIGREGPLLKSYHVKEEERKREECYLEHVILCWEKFMEMKQRYIKPIARRFAATFDVDFDEELCFNVEKALTIAILHHDIGKLTKEYQERKWYRHELPGAYIVNQLLLHSLANKVYKHQLCSIVSAAVYLHHEAIQLAHGWLELRSPTLDYLLRVLLRVVPSLTFREGSEDVFKSVNTLVKSNEDKLLYDYDLPRLIKGKEVAKYLGKLMSYLDGMPRANAIRLTISSFLLLITEVDNEAARVGRGIK